MSVVSMMYSLPLSGYALNGACCPVAAVKQAKASAYSQKKYSEARHRRR